MSATTVPATGGRRTVPAPGADDTAGTKRVVAWLLVLVVAAAVLVVASPDPEPPYTTTSEDPRGTDILRRVLDDLGMEVVEGDAGSLLDGLAPADVAVLFRDQLTSDQEDRVRAHVRDGGRLVVAAPGSPLAGRQKRVAGIGAGGAPGCDLLPARTVISQDVDPFEGRDATLVPDLFEVAGSPTQVCWEDDGAALVGVWDGLPGGGDAGDGSGRTVVLGDPDVVTNAAIMAEPVLGQLATLFLPADAGRVVVLVGTEAPPAPVGPEGSVPDNLRRGMWLAAVALALFAAARARRHGRVVAEAPPVEVPASALAGGIAELLERHGQADDAATRLRAELRSELGPRLGTGDRDAAVLVPLVARATGLDREVVATALADGPVPGAAGLVAVAAAGSTVRAALDTQRPEPSGAAADQRSTTRGPGGTGRRGTANDRDDPDAGPSDPDAGSHDNDVGPDGDPPDA